MDELYNIAAALENIQDLILEGSTDFDDYIEYKQSSEREIYLGDIYENTGKYIDKKIRFWNKIDDENNIPIENREPIKIYIDSYGGVLNSAFSIVDSITMSKTPIYTICTNCAYSGAFLIFICGHKRFAYKNATFMFHEGSITSGQLDAGKFRNYSNFYEKQLLAMKDIVLTHTQIDEKTYERYQKDDFWLMSNEAIAMGICDEILGDFI